MTKNKNKRKVGVVNAGPRRQGNPRTRGKGTYRVTGAPNVMQGSGGFWGDAWERGRKYIPRAIGGAAGYLTGGGAGAAKGWGMGGQFSKNVLGWGDYGIPWQVVNNTLVTESGVPMMHDTGDSGFKIQHKEFLGPIYSTTAFFPNTYTVNPGIWGTFPWLSTMAANFQQYKLLGAIVVFEPVLPDGMASFQSLGSVMIAAQMNPAASNFTSEIQMMQTKFVTASKPTQKLWAPIECSPISGSGSNNLLIRTGAVPSNQVINDYDYCKFTVATTGQPSAGVMLGKLWFTTEVLLLNPISGEGVNVWGARYTFTGVDNTHPIGTAATKAYDDFGVVVAPASNTITFPTGVIGKVRFSYCIVVASGATTLPTFTATNGTVVFAGNQHYGPAGGETATRAYESYVYNITDSNVAFVLTVGNITAGAVSYCDICIDDVSPNYA